MRNRYTFPVDICATVAYIVGIEQRAVAQDGDREMTSYTTKTKEFGSITFVAPTATDKYDGYVWLEAKNGKRRQICYGGKFLGNTVTAKPNQLKAVAQRWMRDRREWMRKVDF